MSQKLPRTVIGMLLLFVLAAGAASATSSKGPPHCSGDRRVVRSHAVAMATVGEPIEPNWAHVFSMPDSQCSWEMSGTGTDQYGFTYSVSASGTLPWAHYRQDPSPPYVRFTGNIDVQERTMEGWLYGSAGPVTVTVVDPYGNQSTEIYHLAFPGDIEFALDGAFNVLAGTTFESSFGVSTLTQWDLMESRYAPDASVTCAATDCKGVEP